MENILAIDPGSEESAYVLYDGKLIVHGKPDNETMLDFISLTADLMTPGRGRLVIESTKPFAIQMASGRSMFPSQVYDTAIWIGRFIERWRANADHPYSLIDRREIKLALLGSANGTDARVRAAVVDHYGFNELNKAKGTKQCPGPLFGVTADRMQALAVALAYSRARRQEPA